MAANSLWNLQSTTPMSRVTGMSLAEWPDVFCFFAFNFLGGQGKLRNPVTCGATSQCQSSFRFSFKQFHLIYVTLGESLNLTVPSFLHLQNEDKRIYFIWLSWRLNELKNINCFQRCLARCLFKKSSVFNLLGSNTSCFPYSATLEKFLCLSTSLPFQLSKGDNKSTQFVGLAGI